MIGECIFLKLSTYHLNRWLIIDDLSLNDYSNVHFVGDALSARGITVSGAHGIYVAESLIRGNILEQITGEGY
jgi:hypothetical protein